MEELIGVLARFLGSIISELIFGTVFYFIGWPFVKVATWGNYPANGWLNGSKEEAYVCCVGIVVFAITLMAVLGQFGI